MNNTNTGGPAFPTSANNLTNDGMTLRDYFAAKAMQALIVAADGELHHQNGAYDAYEYADAMLRKREA